MRILVFMIFLHCNQSMNSGIFYNHYGQLCTVDQDGNIRVLTELPSRNEVHTPRRNQPPILRPQPSEPMNNGMFYNHYGQLCSVNQDGNIRVLTELQPRNQAHTPRRQASPTQHPEPSERLVQPGQQQTNLIGFKKHDLLHHRSTNSVAKYRDGKFYEHPTGIEIEPGHGDIVTRSGDPYAIFENDKYRLFGKRRH